MNKDKVLSIRDLSISFQTSAGEVNAIRGVNLDLYQGGKRWLSWENRVPENQLL